MEPSNLNKLYTFQHPFLQQFPLPYTIIRYIINDPTPKAWKKLIQTCKYFCSKNIAFPCGTARVFCSSKCDIEHEHIDLKNLVKQLWLINHLYAEYVNHIPNLISSFIPKIYKNDLRNLDISDQILTWKEYQFLTSSCFLKRFWMFGCTIKYSDGKIVTFDKLLENLDNINIFYMYCSSNSLMFESNTVEKVVKILSHFKNMHRFVLNGLPETFDFSSIIDFLMTNESIQIQLTYVTFLFLSVPYKQTLDNFIQKVFENPPKRIPDIRYPGFDGTRFKEYQKLLRQQILSNSCI